jgi:transposase-like protein
MAKKKTLTTIFEDFKFVPPECPHCKSNEEVVKSGTRSLKEDMAQVFLCKNCNKRFSGRKLPRTSYPPKVILASLSYYNQGHTLDMTIRTMRRKYKVKIPASTLSSWISRHQDELPATKLRKKYTLDPNQTIKTRRLFHPQPYLFKVHTLKLNIKGKQFPELKRYINDMLNNPMDHLFQSKKVLRVSELANTVNLPKPNIRSVKDSPASRMTDLALELAKTKSERHQKVEEFFLINDSATVAIEVPVYLTEKESGFKKPLTGHIDLIQVRSNRIHIMDYKPDESQNVINQLQLYAKCLKKRIRLSNITCAYFDDNGYFQFNPSF